MNAFLIYDGQDRCVVTVGEAVNHPIGEEFSNDPSFRLLRAVPFNDSLKALFEALPHDEKTRVTLDAGELYGVVREVSILGWNAAVDIWGKPTRMTSDLFNKCVTMPKPPQLIYEVKDKAEYAGFDFSKAKQVLIVRQVRLMMIACFQASLIVSRAQ